MYLDEAIKNLVGKRYSYSTGMNSFVYQIENVKDDIGFYHLECKDGKSNQISYDDMEKFVGGEKVSYVSPSQGRWSLQLLEEKKDVVAILLERAKNEIVGKYFSCEQYDETRWHGEILSVEHIDSSNQYLILYSKDEELPIVGLPFSEDDLEILLDCKELHLSLDVNYYISENFEDFKKQFYGCRQYFSLRDSLELWKNRWWELFLKASDVVLNKNQSWDDAVQITNQGIKSASYGLKEFLNIVDEEG